MGFKLVMSQFPIAKVEGYLLSLIEKLEKAPEVLFIPLLSKLRKNIPQMHYHTFPELFLQTAADDLFVFPDEKKVIKAGEACLVPRGLPHKEVVEKDKAKFENIVFMYINDGLTIHFANVAPDKNYPQISIFQNFYTEESYRTFQYLNDAIEFCHLGYPINHPLVKYPFLTAIHCIKRILSKSVEKESKLHHKVSLCKGIILSQIADPKLNIKSLAKKVGTSSDYLGRLFQKEAGCSLNYYIQQQRILMARELLSKSDLDIKQVCRQTGFVDPSYFTKVFKKLVQISPKEYRKNAN